MNTFVYRNTCPVDEALFVKYGRIPGDSNSTNALELSMNPQRVAHQNYSPWQLWIFLNHFYHIHYFNHSVARDAVPCIRFGNRNAMESNNESFPKRFDLCKTIYRTGVKRCWSTIPLALWRTLSIRMRFCFGSSVMGTRALWSTILLPTRIIAMSMFLQVYHIKERIYLAVFVGLCDRACAHGVLELLHIKSWWQGNRSSLNLPGRLDTTKEIRKLTQFQWLGLFAFSLIQQLCEVERTAAYFFEMFYGLFLDHLPLHQMHEIFEVKLLKRLGQLHW